MTSMFSALGFRFAVEPCVNGPRPWLRLPLAGPRPFRTGILLLAALFATVRAGAAGEVPPSTSADPLAAWVREVRQRPEEYTYSGLALRAAREIYPDLNAAQEAAFGQELERLAGTLRARLKGARTGKEKVEAASALLFQGLALRRAPEEIPEKENPNHYFPHAVLAGKEGVCLGLALVYLAVAERTGLPVVPVHAPQHLYLRYDDGRERLNLEPTDAGRIFDERAFMARYLMKPDEAARGPYFRPLGKLEVVGDLLNALAWFSAVGTAAQPLPPERAVLAGRLCVELGPADFNNWDTLAQALRYAGRPGEALAALREALARRPAVSGSQDERYWKDRLARFAAAAEPAPAPVPAPQAGRQRTAGP